jgi:hypothetical protein
VRGGARFVPRFFINHVVSAMHKIVIRDMQARLVRSPMPVVPATPREESVAI